MSSTTNHLQQWFPQATHPFVCLAPMYGIANAQLAVAVHKAGGFGFIAGGFDFNSPATISTLESELTKARDLLELADETPLPLGVALLTLFPANAVEALTPCLLRHRPAALWLAFPSASSAHTELIPRFKTLGEPWGMKAFVQIGTVQAAREAVRDGADVIVAQGVDAGGHQWAQGAGVVSLVPEIRDVLAAEFANRDIAILGAGGIVDGRGVAAAMALGADGVVMGTRFVVTTESPAAEAIKNLMVSTSDGASSTIKSRVHDDINGTAIWPAVYDGRAIIGDSYRDFAAGLSQEENIAKFKAALAAGDFSRRIAWAGTGIGLITRTETAEKVVRGSQQRAKEVLQELAERMQKLT